jgi:MFS family permease
MPVPTSRTPLTLVAATATGADRRRSLRALAVGLVLAVSTWFSTGAALPSLRAELGLGAADERAAVVALQLAFATAAAGVALTGLADRVPPSRLAAAGALAAAAANSAPVLVAHPVVVVGSRALVGAALALVFPPLLKAAGAWAGRDRGRVLGAMIGALTLGSASPHLVNGLTVASWRALLLTTSAAAVLGAVVVTVGAGDAPDAPAPGRVTVGHVRTVLRSRPLRLTSLGYVGHMWELYAGWAAIGPFMAAVWVAPRASGLSAFAVVAVGAVAAAGWGRVGDRLGRERAAMIAMVTSASLVAVLGHAAGRPALVTALALVWGAAVIADSGQFPALVADHAEPTLVGSALSVQMALGFAATAVASWLVPVVQGAAGWSWALACLAPGPLLGALALHRLRSHPRPPALAPVSTVRTPADAAAAALS